MTVARNSGSSLICPKGSCLHLFFMQTGLSLKNLPLTSLTHHTFMGPRQHKQAADASASHLILKLGSLCRPQPVPACLPNGFRKIGLGKPFFRKNRHLPKPFNLSESWIVSELSLPARGPGRAQALLEGAFRGCSVPRLPSDPVLLQALFSRDTVRPPREGGTYQHPRGLTGQWALPAAWFARLHRLVGMSIARDCFFR